ncbi:hypothetical protein TspCOW1_04800 [Thiohalobacter sp. COW1]|uniref:FkbM family methyltransferase n=1 Tax=Thiohalobacter sp. COW1 TaxID=2795687 RepID=UPI001914F2AB|nr:FkbM family methyltransferase [Thiohalobacter sp. COW1]BCO30377.1 hypothetical protein TspCOW1_04800 [Thiohalobacter sp. COW1]
MLRTESKLLLARQLHKLVMSARALLGLSRVVEAKRGNINWSLDLNEGIDFYIYLLGRFEKSTANVYESLIKESDVVIDVGANVGAHTLPFARLVGTSGKVIAVEPTDYAFNKLRQNITRNPELSEQVIALQGFIGSAETNGIPKTVYSSWPLSPVGGKHSRHGGWGMATDNASYMTIDDLCRIFELDALHLIKIDVDGYELEVLSGALNSIRRYRPYLIIEIAPYVLHEHEVSPGEILSLLRGLNYKITSEKSFKPISDIDNFISSIPDGAGVNVVGIPQ